MPGRNVLKTDAPDSFYHIYSRGVDKQTIFGDDSDYAVFMNLLKRYLSNEPAKDRLGREYPHLHEDLELISFCLMPNHIHLLIYQINQGSMQKLMRGLLTSYSNYFNKNHHRRGPLFESRYKASLISDQSYLEHISRYIHLNAQDWRDYPYSSLEYFLGKEAEWVKPERVMDMFDGSSDYLKFVSDYEDNKKMLAKIKSELANS